MNEISGFRKRSFAKMAGLQNLVPARGYEVKISQRRALVPSPNLASSDHRRRSLHWRHPPDSVHFGCIALVNVNEDCEITLCRVDQIALQIKDEKA